jgi:hypothetical protein
MEQYTYIVNIQRHSNVGGIQAVSKTTTRNTTSTWIDLRVILRNVEQMHFSPRADGAKRRARVLIPLGYLHPGKRKY